MRKGGSVSNKNVNSGMGWLKLEGGRSEDTVDDWGRKRVGEV